jgi:hypothetical protein
VFRGHEQVGPFLRLHVAERMGENGDACDVEPAVRDRVVDERESSRHTCSPDALARHVLGEAELPDAVVKHRGEAGRCVEPACIDFGDVSEEQGR